MFRTLVIIYSEQKLFYIITNNLSLLSSFSLSLASLRSAINNMHLVQQILFIVLALFSTWLFTKKIKEIRRNILLGHDEDFSDNPASAGKMCCCWHLGKRKCFVIRWWQ